MTGDSTPTLSEEQKQLVQEGVAKVRCEHRSLNAPSPQDFELIYAAVAKDLAKLDPTSNPDPATIPNPALRNIFEETRDDMVKQAAGRHALDSDIATLREEAKGAAGLEVKQVPVGTLGLKEDVITGDLLKPEQAPAVVKDGEFKLPEAMAHQALDAVKKLGKKGEVQGMEEAAFLDGNPNEQHRQNLRQNSHLGEHLYRRYCGPRLIAFSPQILGQLLMISPTRKRRPCCWRRVPKSKCLRMASRSPPPSMAK
jgi:hypothetical protein